jgi:uncharacterized protein (TIGR03067 family)
MARWALLIVGVACCVAADKPSDAVQKEYQRLEGTWQFVSIEMEGKQIPAQFFKGSSLILHGDQCTMKDSAATYHGTYTLDVTRTPKELDVNFTDGPEKGKKALGIYELEGDTYRVCLGLTGKSRPTEFASKPGSGHVLEVLKREKGPAEKGAERKDKK